MLTNYRYLILNCDFSSQLAFGSFLGVLGLCLEENRKQLVCTLGLYIYIYISVHMFVLKNAGLEVAEQGLPCRNFVTFDPGVVVESFSAQRQIYVRFS